LQAKHTVRTPIKEGDIRNLLLGSLADLKTGSMFDPEIFANIIIEDVDIVSMHREISPIYNKLEETSDSDEFLARFMGRIARNSSKYGTNFSSPAAMLVMKKLAEKLLHFYRKSSAEHESCEPPKPITTDCMDGIQYLAGYVVRKFFKRSPEDSVIRKVMSEMKTDDYADQKLVSLQSRGGLTALTNEAQQIFVKAEEKFRRNTNLKDIQKIDTRLMVKQLLKDTDLICIFNRILQDLIIDDDQKHGILSKMLGLYLRVRAFSLAKKITSQHRLKNKKGKSKALRKELKEKSEIVKSCIILQICIFQVSLLFPFSS
jgi:hypothetical protein